MDQYRQGLDYVRIFKGTAPTERADGTPLDQSEISHYIRFAKYNGNIEEMDVQLVNGQFSESLAVDNVGLGVYEYWYRTVDTEGRQSVDSNVLSFEVLAPLANPLPPLVQ